MVSLIFSFFTHRCLSQEFLFPWRPACFNNRRKSLALSHKWGTADDIFVKGDKRTGNVKSSENGDTTAWQFVIVSVICVISGRVDCGLDKVCVDCVATERFSTQSALRLTNPKDVLVCVSVLHISGQEKVPQIEGL